MGHRLETHGLDILGIYVQYCTTAFNFCIQASKSVLFSNNANSALCPGNGKREVYYLITQRPRLVAKMTMGAMALSKARWRYVKVSISNMWTSSMNKTPGTNSAIPWSMYLLTTLLISFRSLSVKEQAIKYLLLKNLGGKMQYSLSATYWGKHKSGFNVLLTVHHAMILGNCPTWRTNSFQCFYLYCCTVNLFNVFIYL